VLFTTRNKEVKIVFELVNSPNIVSLCTGFVNLREEQNVNLLQTVTHTTHCFANVYCLAARVDAELRYHQAIVIEHEYF
jgi:hypothetical protein